MNKETEIPQYIKDEAEKHGFQVPYDGTKNFYNMDKVNSFISGAMFEKDNWVKVEDGKPFVKEGEDNSENVFAICNGKLTIMAWCYIDEGYDDVDEKHLGGWVWCNCNNDINGDPEFDDDYRVTHWRYLPTPPESIQ